MTTPRNTRLWLVRHGATDWSTTGRHTSVTDLELLPEGREQATMLGPKLADTRFGLVLASPRLRARETAECAGFPHRTSIPTSWSGPTVRLRA